MLFLEKLHTEFFFFFEVLFILYWQYLQVFVYLSTHEHIQEFEELKNVSAGSHMGFYHIFQLAKKISSGSNKSLH